MRNVSVRDLRKHIAFYLHHLLFVGVMCVSSLAVAKDAPPARPAGGRESPAAAWERLGLPNYEQPSAYSEDLVVTYEGQTYIMKRAVTDTKMRTEMTVDGQEMIIIEMGDKRGTMYLGVNFDLGKLDPGGHAGGVMAWDVAKGKAAWFNKDELPYSGGMLSTAGGVVFHGDLKGWFKALDVKTGKTLWKFNAGSGISHSHSCRRPTQGTAAHHYGRFDRDARTGADADGRQCRFQDGG